MKAKRTTQLIATIGLALALLIAAGCGDGADEEQIAVVGAEPDATATSTTPPSPETTTSATAVATSTVDPDANASVMGTVTYRERIALSPGAVVTVQLRDTSLMDVASELIAEQVITNPGQVPIEFEVHYNEDDINPRNTYSIQARITESDGRLAFINDTAYDVITRGNPTRVDMVLVIVQPPPDPTGEWNEENSHQWVEEEVEVIGAEVVEYHPEVIILVDHYQSTVENCVRRGSQSFEIIGSDIYATITLTVPPPTPWAIDCDAERVVVEEAIRFGDALTPGQTYTVFVNGTETTTFTAPLANTQ
ncbi:YbaY family lipoprotein [Candidatus Poriferisocius sp.]|uniref:YbaY family lipoprotein n=1 Tax=Candidatus Poriferisocius sp. TaxID=3101276 RepID=UPI003B5BE6DD